MYQLRLARLCLALAFTSCQPPAAEAFDPAQQMIMSAPIPRFLLPRGYMRPYAPYTPYAQLPKLVKLSQTAHRTPPICRNASASTSKPRVLEKPTRFNPPSHGKRLKKQTPRQYGPQLTGEQKTEQETKRYPRMMPPEGTFMHWFLTSQGIHTFIALVRGQLKSLHSLPAKSDFSLKLRC